jgi:TrmH family RNA methyltransferase
VSTPVPVLPLQPIGPSHEAARLYSRARRNLLPREEHLVAVSGRWQHDLLRRTGVRAVVTLCCGASPLVPAEATYETSARTLARLHPGVAPPALLSVVRLPHWRRTDVLRPDSRLVLVADGIEYAGNLGTLVRTADAAGADGVVLTSAAARVTHPKVFVASRGTLLTMPVLEYSDVIGAKRDLSMAGFTVYVADPAAAVDYRDVGYEHRKVAIVVGSEGAGVAAEWRTPDLTRVSIPMRGHADSLNVAASASVLLFDAAARSAWSEPPVPPGTQPLRA